MQSNVDVFSIAFVKSKEAFIVDWIYALFTVDINLY